MRSFRAKRVREAVCGVALALLWMGCAGTPMKAPERRGAAAEPLVPRLHQAARDFLAAREAGDALGMARAAAARRALDGVQIRLADAQRAAAFLTADAMLEEARALAGRDAALREKIDRIGAGRTGAGLGSALSTNLASALCRGGGVDACLQPRPVREELLPPRDGALHPIAVALAPRAERSWRVRVPAEHTLWVSGDYVPGAALTLRADAGDVPCGFVADLLCHWRPAGGGSGVLTLENRSERALTIGLLAELAWIPE